MKSFIFTASVSYTFLSDIFRSLVNLHFYQSYSIYSIQWNFSALIFLETLVSVRLKYYYIIIIPFLLSDNSFCNLSLVFLYLTLGFFHKDNCLAYYILFPQYPQRYLYSITLQTITDWAIFGRRKT